MLENKQVFLKKRWYDYEPSVSYAVYLLQRLDDRNLNAASEIMIELAKLQCIEIDLRIAHKQRWYDENQKLSLAMRYLQKGDSMQREFIAREVIYYILQKHPLLIDEEILKRNDLRVF